MMRTCVRVKPNARTFFVTESKSLPITNSLFANILKTQVSSVLTASLYRKLTVTLFRDLDADPDTMRQLADHMGHATNTQKEWYDHSNKIKSSVAVSKQIRRLGLNASV